MIYYGKQSINQDDIEAVVGVLESNFLTQGPRLSSLRGVWRTIAAQSIQGLLIMELRPCI